MTVEFRPRARRVWDTTNSGAIACYTWAGEDILLENNSMYACWTITPIRRVLDHHYDPDAAACVFRQRGVESAP